MTKVTITSVSDVSNLDLEFGYVVSTDKANSNLFYRNRAKLIDRKYILESTERKGLKSTYTLLKTVISPEQAKRDLIRLARIKADEFSRELDSQLENKAQGGKK